MQRDARAHCNGAAAAAACFASASIALARPRDGSAASMKRKHPGMKKRQWKPVSLNNLIHDAINSSKRRGLSYYRASALTPYIRAPIASEGRCGVVYLKSVPASCLQREIARADGDAEQKRLLQGCLKIILGARLEHLPAATGLQARHRRVSGPRRDST